MFDDEKMAAKIKKDRDDAHPTIETQANEDFQPGMNILLKADKSKMKARSPYRIVELFEKNNRKVGSNSETRLPIQGETIQGKILRNDGNTRTVIRKEG